MVFDNDSGVRLIKSRLAVTVMKNSPILSR